MMEINPNCSNQITECLLEGVREVIGPDDFEAVLSEALISPLAAAETQIGPAAVYKLQSVCTARYGRLSARGMALRSGQSSFTYFLKKFGQQAGFEELDFRLLSPKKRIFSGLRTIAQIFAEQCGVPIHTANEANQWVLEVGTAEGCSPQDEIPCGFILGLLKEYMTWISGGKLYAVQETTCRESGSPVCRFVIDQRPLD